MQNIIDFKMYTSQFEINTFYRLFNLPIFIICSVIYMLYLRAYLVERFNLIKMNI